MDSSSLVLATNLKNLCLPSGLTIAVAESLTSGNLQAKIASIDGASNYYLGGITVYNIDQKVKHLGVNRAHAASVNCVSERVAGEMVAGVRTLFGADVAAATTGYAGPWPEQGIESPYAFFAIDVLGEALTGRIDADQRNRTEVQHHVTHQVLRELVRRLEMRESRND